MTDALSSRMPDARSHDSAPSDPNTYAIIGAAMAVHTELGCGFLEAVYRAALRIEFQRRRMDTLVEVVLPIDYKGEPLPLSYRVDFVCRDVLIEVKALNNIGPIEVAQALNYLKASHKTLALILNFGNTSLQHRRIALNYPDGVIRR